MAESRFLYVIYIRASAETVWAHFTDPAQNKLFWAGYHQRSTWKSGADYEIVSADGEAWDTGKVLAIEPPRHLQVTWNHQHDAEMKAEGESTVTLDLEEAAPGVTRLTLSHVIGVANSKLIEAVTGGWPSLLSSLKSLIETGKAIG
jgi:uncharacterized protein YndB with AHSA1/START domain